MNSWMISLPRTPAPILRRLLLASRARSAGLLGLALAIGTASAVAQLTTATIEGRIQSAATGRLLNNARVLAEGANLEVLTDADGSYRLRNVPAGTVRLRVSYTGLETQVTSLTVAAATTTRRDFALNLPAAQATFDPKDVVKLDSFVVESTALSAAAAAQNEQKMAPNIKNVVVLDEIGVLLQMKKPLGALGLRLFAGRKAKHEQATAAAHQCRGKG